MSGRVPSLRPDQVLAALKRGGYYVHHVTGSHHAIRHPDKPAVRITVARHNKELKRGTLRGIIRQAELSVDDFINLL